MAQHHSNLPPRRIASQHSALPGNWLVVAAAVHLQVKHLVKEAADSAVRETSAVALAYGCSRHERRQQKSPAGRGWELASFWNERRDLRQLIGVGPAAEPVAAGVFERVALGIVEVD